MTETFTCFQCAQTKPVLTNGGVGYGCDKNDNKICYDCCGVNDRKAMIETGRAVLYLSKGKEDKWEITNWPGTLRFNAGYMKTGRHNIAGKRTDTWFVGPDKYVWHAKQIGDNNTIAHCKRTKEIAR